MADDQPKAEGPDLEKGIGTDVLADGAMLKGHVKEDEVLLVRRGDRIFAVGAHCTHYHGPLGDGVIVGNTVRCPWHHACFDLETGEALHAPALSPLECWEVERQGEKNFVRHKAAQPKPKRVIPPKAGTPEKIVIIGGGAAGFAAAEMLRRVEYQGSIVMLSDDDAPPVDRPNLSKDYLAGNAPEDWVPLRAESFYSENNIDLRLGTKVAAIDPRLREVALANGSRIAFDRLLLATGSEAIRLPIPGAGQPHVYTLRSLADCRAIIARAVTSSRVVVVGASFIGLEVAASLRARNIEAHVVAPEKRPMERILGPQMGDFIRGLHEQHGVIFHLEDKPKVIESARVGLTSGATIDADFVVIGAGVRPRTELAQAAGLAIDRGIVVDACLETSVPTIYAAGDIARWPDGYSGQSIRVEHWVVAERQGQTAALNMLGQQKRFDAAPFFWSQHYDIPINYVGHAERWDEIAVEGDIAAKDCVLRFKQGGRTLAVASIFRDIESLEAEIRMEQSVNSERKA